jgi:hypothetical protein
MRSTLGQENKLMATIDDLLKALGGAPPHNDPELGKFFKGLDGSWRHSCTADFPFQEDVTVIFDVNVKTEKMPSSMPQNVAWIQEHLTEIWNSAAFAINDMVEAKQIEMVDEFALDSLYFELYDTPVDSGRWTLTIEPSYLNASFKVTFEGLSVIDQEYETA